MISDYFLNKMRDKKSFKLILKSHTFSIPSDAVTLSKVDDVIYQILNSNGEYKVKSKVTYEVFQQFVDHWINQQIPVFNFDNIIQFDRLAKEFGRMKNLVKIYQNFLLSTNVYLIKGKNDSLHEKVQYCKKRYKKTISKNSQIIENIFNNPYFIFPQAQELKKEIYNACFSNYKKFETTIQRKVAQNDFLFSLNEKDCTASLIKNLSTDTNIISIPYSIFYNSKEFIVTSIGQNAFEKCTTIKTIKFPQNSQIEIIGDHSFDDSLIHDITIPSSVKRICK